MKSWWRTGNQRQRDAGARGNARGPAARRVHHDRRVDLAARGRDPGGAAARTQQALHGREGEQARAQLARARGEADRDARRIDPAVARHVEDAPRGPRLEVRREPLGLGRVDQARLDAEALRGLLRDPHALHAGVGVGGAQAAGAVEVHRAAHLALEALERLAGLVAKPGHGGHRVGLAREPGRARGRLRAQRVLVHQRDLEPAPGQVIRGARPEGARADDDRVGGAEAAAIHQASLEPCAVSSSVTGRRPRRKSKSTPSSACSTWSRNMRR